MTYIIIWKLHSRK